MYTQQKTTNSIKCQQNLILFCSHSSLLSNGKKVPSSIADCFKCHTFVTQYEKSPVIIDEIKSNEYTPCLLYHSQCRTERTQGRKTFRYASIGISQTTSLTNRNIKFTTILKKETYYVARLHRVSLEKKT